MSTNQKQLEVEKATAAADSPQAVTLGPDEVVVQLRALQGQIVDVEPLTQREREIARQEARLGVSHEATQATINAIGESEVAALAVGQPAGDVRQLGQEIDHWTVVEAELRKMLQGISDANVIRRQRLGIITAKGYNICRQLARDNAALRPHVKEIQRLRRLARRKKSAPQTPETPSSGTPSSESGQ